MAVNTTVEKMVSLAFIGDVSSAINSSSSTPLNEQVSSTQLTHVVTSKQQQPVSIGEPSLSELPPDIIKVLFEKCLSQSHLNTLGVLTCLNKRWKNIATEFEQGLDPKSICPELTILDAKAQGIKCDDEPKINNFKIIKWAKALVPHVEGNAGVTKLTIPKETTLKKVMNIANEAELTVGNPLGLVQTHGDVTVEETYIILITNNVFKKSCGKDAMIDFDERGFENGGRSKFDLEKTITEYGCKIPEIQEYVALFVFMKKVFNKSVYQNSNEHPYPSCVARSSSSMKSFSLACRSSSATQFDVRRCDSPSNCAGGKRKL